MIGDAIPKLPEPGDVVAGKYEIVQPIGKGGMGVVYEAVHVRLKQRVAIKMLYPHVRSTPGAIERFEREARAAGQLRGPNVARVLDVETQGSDLPYIVMEYLEGSDLDDVLAGGGRLPIERAVDYILQACMAMREAHLLGIVHRDLKPANLFLCETADGPVIKVLDFGISKITYEADGKLTGPLQTMGSPIYMSPEQLRGLRGVDARTDLWALGVTLFELIAGRPPFRGTVTTTIAAILSDPPPAPSSMRRDTPAGLDEVVLRALAKKPADRYPDAEAFAEALVPFASESAVRKLRACLAAPLPVPSGRGPGAFEPGDRQALTVSVREGKSYAPGGETAQSWSTVPVGFGRSPRKRFVLLSVGIGVVVGTLAAALMIVRSPRRDDDAAESRALVASTPSPSSAAPQAPAAPATAEGPAEREPVNASASAAPWTVIPLDTAPGLLGPWVSAGGLSDPRGAPRGPAAGPSTAPARRRPSSGGSHHAPPAAAPANPTHL